MLVRMDGKLDVLAAKVSYYDVEVALLKARADRSEAAIKERADGDQAARELMALEVRNLKDGQLTLGKGLKWATATIIGAGIVLDAVLRFYR